MVFRRILDFGASKGSKNLRIVHSCPNGSFNLPYSSPQNCQASGMTGRATAQADQRSHLDLQVNLLAGAKSTDTLKMLRALCAHHPGQRARKAPPDNS